MEEMHPSSFQDAPYAGMSSGATRSSPSSSPGVSHTSTDASSTMTLTRKSLTKHRRHSNRLWSNPTTSLQMRQDRSEQIRAAIRSLDVDLPKRVVNKMAASF